MKKIIAVCLLTFGIASNSHATTFDNAFTQIPGFTPGQSYDLPPYALNPFIAFSSIVAPGVFSAGTFTGAPGGSILEFQMLGGVTAFNGTIPGRVDTFGYLSSFTTGYTSLLDNITIGSTTSLNLGASDSLTFAFQSPLSTFSSIAADNVNGENHIVFLQVTQNATLTLDFLSYHDTAPYTFTFLAGDVIALNEDLFHACINNHGGNPCGDADFNDMMVRIRHTAVPEPASVILGSLGMGALLRRRRRRSE